MKDILNVGLVGYKFMGKAHSNAFQRVGMFFEPSMDIRMKAICGRDEEWVNRQPNSSDGRAMKLRGKNWCRG